MAGLKRVTGNAAAAAVVAVLAGAGIAPPAHAEPGGGEIGFKVDRRYCNNDGQQITIGGGVLQRENGKHGVVQLEVKWLLYINDTTGGWKRASAKKTLRSTKFTNTSRSHWWDADTGGREGGGKGNGHHFKVSALHSYKLVAKMRWKRGGWRNDWTRKLATTVCS